MRCLSPLKRLPPNPEPLDLAELGHEMMECEEDLLGQTA
jgi:hypothetical protein